MEKTLSTEATMTIVDLRKCIDFLEEHDPSYPVRFSVYVTLETQEHVERFLRDFPAAERWRGTDMWYMDAAIGSIDFHAHIRERDVSSFPKAGTKTIPAQPERTVPVFHTSGWPDWMTSGE